MICAASLSRSEAVWAPSIQRALSLSSISRLARGATGALPRVQMRAPTSPRTACSSASTATIGWTKNPGVLPSPPGPRPLRPAQRAKLISLVSCAHTTRRPAQARTVRMLDASMIVSTLKRGDDSRRCTATSPDRVPPMVLSTNDPVETIRSNSSTPRASTRGSPRPSSSIQKPQSSLRPLNQSDAKIETNFRASRSPRLRGKVRVGLSPPLNCKQSAGSSHDDLALDLHRHSERQFGHAHGTARMGSGFRSPEFEDQVGKAIDHGRLPDKAGRGIDHAENAHPLRYAIEIAERALQRTQHRQRGEFCRGIALLERQLAPNLAQRLRQRPFGTLRTMPRDDAAIPDQADIDEGQGNARRWREGRRQHQAESDEASFDPGHQASRFR